MITQRAWLVGTVGLCFYLIVLVNNSLPNLYYALTWLSVGVLVSSLGVALLSLSGLNCDWRVARSQVTEATPGNAPSASAQRDSLHASARLGPVVEVRLANTGTFNKTNVLLEITLQHQRRGEALTRRFLLESLPAGISLDTALALRDLPRGRYRVTGIRLIGSDVLGLFQVQRRVTRGQPQNQDAATGADLVIGPAALEVSGDELVVGPALVTLQGKGAAWHFGAANGSRNALGLLGNSDEIRGTRHYVPGDDLRTVHWKSTARQGQLVVKEFHRQSQAGAVIIWDGAAETTYGEEKATSTDYSLRLTASLCRAVTERGRTCAMLRLDSQPLWITPSAGQGMAGATLARVTEALADAEADRAGSLAVALSAYLNQLVPGTDVYLVTASLSPDVRRAAVACSARGARVVVGLVDGAALLNPERRAVAAGQAHSRAERAARVPRQHWSAGPDGQWPAGGSAVSSASYHAQQEALREVGIPVVILSPPPSAHDDFAPPVREALHNLLELQSLAGMKTFGLKGGVGADVMQHG